MKRFLDKINRSFSNASIDELLSLAMTSPQLAAELNRQISAIRNYTTEQAAERWKKFADGEVLSLVNESNSEEIRGDVVYVKLHPGAHCAGDADLGFFYILKSVSDCLVNDITFSRPIDRLTAVYQGGFIAREFDRERTYTRDSHDWLCFRARRYLNSDSLEAFVRVSPDSVAAYEFLERGVYLDRIDKNKISAVVQRNSPNIW